MREGNYMVEDSKAKLTILVGLPYSGKSTYCDNLLNFEYTILCPDDVRIAMHGHAFIKEAEPFVWAVVDAAASALLARNNNVIIDATNVTYGSRQMWRKMADKHGIPLYAIVMQTSEEECKRRAMASDNDHMVEVIERMSGMWMDVDEEEDIIAIKG